MFKFDKFPVTLRLEKKDRFGEHLIERDVEVFGYVCDKQLIGCREWDTVNGVYFLPIDVFNKRFKEYVLVDED